MKRRTFLKSTMVFSSSLFLATGYAYNSNSLEVSRTSAVLPRAKKRVRIVAVSDVHGPTFFRSEQELLSRINSESPDIFVLAGDIVDRRGDESFIKIFETINAATAKIAVLGNWEYYGKLSIVKLRSQYEKLGIKLLVNSALQTSGLTIIGLDDFLYGSPDYGIFDSFQNESTPILVVSHCPESFNSFIHRLNFPAIVLSGHTHGGQIAPFGFVYHTPKGSGRYIQGWYKNSDHSLYVMRGIGTTPGLPVRIGAKPEVLVLDILPG